MPQCTSTPQLLQTPFALDPTAHEIICNRMIPAINVMFQTRATDTPEVDLADFSAEDLTE